MEAKKSPKADLENRKGLFLEIGLIVILALAFLAFNIKKYEREQVEAISRTVVDEVEETVLNTEEQEKPPEPEPVQEQVLTDIEVVDNDATIENEVDMSAFTEEVLNVDVSAPIVEEKEEEVVEEVVIIPDVNPEFGGGEAKLYEYLQENIQYPQLARDGGITGKVYVQFVVEKDGSITNVQVKRDIGGGCGDEAKRVVKAMPKWKPGKVGGRTVRSQFVLPVNFNLR
ncbi:MAG: energy transducer TonB [Bacteroidales bacterium]|nr:energy transducer TonB [Bacteroidales bacterium]